MIFVTKPLSKRSRAWRSIPGGKRTWRVVSRARWDCGRAFRGFVVDGGRVLGRVLNMEVMMLRGLGRVVIFWFFVVENENDEGFFYMGWISYFKF